MVSIRPDFTLPSYNNEGDSPKPLYSDLPTNLDVSPFSGDLARLVNKDSVEVSVQHIVLTYIVERPYLDVGSTIQLRVFQQSSIIETELLQNAISNALAAYEPRIRVFSVVVNLNNSEENYIVTVQYRFINNPQIYKVSIIVERNR